MSTTIRNELHWLPVHKRIVYKLCLLVFKCQHEQAPITCRRFVRRSPLSQPVVSCERQLKAISTSREQELSRSFWTYMLELIRPTAISKVTVAETRWFLFTSEDDTHSAGVVTMLQDLRGDKNCSLTLTLTLTFKFQCKSVLIGCW